ncbi:N-acetyltransferase [Salipiger sp. IMCC34102]|uniref:GNAT family N-acetyltransferase n=1 Tax=Salipiger sp. IMCC34102 TaxID=2510647 RepID=UPI00101CD92C|nr:GNAT family protein [Salipiger sp. IMCC34102]RYH01910.1 N-acetyltransferase [Salipiger sp. IMCC34102]
MTAPVDPRPLGEIVKGWAPVPAPPRNLALTGRWCHLRPLDPARDAAPFFDRVAAHRWLFDYLPEPPPARVEDLQAALEALPPAPTLPLAICAAGSQDPLGVACLMSVDPVVGSIEIGHVCLSPELQGTPAATEAMALMLGWAFGAGYRRMVWKCNALNAPSRRAAQRLGFSFEGVSRNHVIVKGRNRDTAWFAMTDADWSTLHKAFDAWLSPANFDADDRQKTRLSTLTAPAVVQRDPTLG